MKQAKAKGKGKSEALAWLAEMKGQGKGAKGTKGTGKGTCAAAPVMRHRLKSAPPTDAEIAEIEKEVTACLNSTSGGKKAKALCQLKLQDCPAAVWTKRNQAGSQETLPYDSKDDAVEPKKKKAKVNEEYEEEEEVEVKQKKAKKVTLENAGTEEEVKRKKSKKVDAENGGQEEELKTKKAKKVEAENEEVEVKDKKAKKVNAEDGGEDERAKKSKKVTVENEGNEDQVKMKKAKKVNAEGEVEVKEKVKNAEAEGRMNKIQEKRQSNETCLALLDASPSTSETSAGTGWTGLSEEDHEWCKDLLDLWMNPDDLQYEDEGDAKDEQKAGYINHIFFVSNIIIYKTI